MAAVLCQKMENNHPLIITKGLKDGAILLETGVPQDPGASENDIRNYRLPLFEYL